MELKERIKRHFVFSNIEIRDFWVVVFVVTFIFGFDDKSDVFVMSNWLLNMIITFFMVTMAFFIQISAQKILALWQGYKAEFKMWNYGLGMGIAFAIMSKGNILLLLPGGVMFQMIEHYRIGKFRHGMYYAHTGWIAAAGPIMNIFVGMFAKQMMNMFGFENVLFNTFIYVNFLLALFMLLPIPPLPGNNLFFGTRMGYALVFGCVLGYVGLYLSGFYSLIIGILIGIVVWILYYILFEKAAW